MQPQNTDKITESKNLERLDVPAAGGAFEHFNNIKFL